MGKEIIESQRLRTIHIGGLSKDTTEDGLRILCANFGDVDHLRIDEDAQGNTFALVMFVEQGAAHVCKTQRKFLVDGRMLVFTEAKTMVNEQSVAEQIINFQAPILDAINMR